MRRTATWRREALSVISLHVALVIQCYVFYLTLRGGICVDLMQLSGMIVFIELWICLCRFIKF